MASWLRKKSLTPSSSNNRVKSVLSNDDDASPKRQRLSEDGKENRSSPIVYLNVGGKHFDVSKKLLLNSRFGENSPLCAMFADASSFPSFGHETVDGRVYLERDPEAFSDLLQYLRYGTYFLRQELASEGGVRLHRLRLEADFFNVFELEEDLEKLGLCSVPVTFRANEWTSFAATTFKSEQSDPLAKSWKWKYHSGSSSILRYVENGDDTLQGKFTAPWGLEHVGDDGSYLLLFRLSSVATPGLLDSQGYLNMNHDEFVNVGILNPGNLEDQPDYHTMVRCGMFDYRDEKERKQDNDQLRFTASFAEVVSLRKGDCLYVAHGSTGLVGRSCSLGQDSDNVHSRCFNRFTLIKIHGNCISKFDRTQQNSMTDENCPSVATWTQSLTDFPPTPFYPELIDTGRAIRTPRDTAGNHHLVLGRVATSQKMRNVDNAFERSSSMQLKVASQGGRCLQATSATCYGYVSDDWKMGKVAVDYGPINDIVCLTSNDQLSVQASNQNIHLAKHGVLPVPFQKVPCQNLFLLSLSPSVMVDRYRFTYKESDYKVKITRSLMDRPPDENDSTTPSFPLFDIKKDELVSAFGGGEDDSMTCIVLGSIPPDPEGRMVDCCLWINDVVWAVSRIPSSAKDGSNTPRHKHTFQEVLKIKRGDRIRVGHGYQRHTNIEHSSFFGNLAFIVMEQHTRERGQSNGAIQFGTEGFYFFEESREEPEST